MGTVARLGVLCLMGLAIALARLVEDELRPRRPALAVPLLAPLPALAPPAPVSTRDGRATTPDGSPSPAPPRAYTVRGGDTLGTISQRVYGTARHWRRLLEANRDALGGDPTRLRPGMSLRVPEVRAPVPDGRAPDRGL